MSSDLASRREVSPPVGPPRTSSALGTYQPGLDGIRGVAMIVMLGYHGQLPWTQGAFLGLSQFFTLSGFLIVGVLLRRHLVPGGGLRSFWARRARRLMPAAFLALAGIVVFGATIATRQQVRGLPGDMIGAVTWTANWRFVIEGKSYINLFAAPSPAQHFWSLAIEEQFYLVLPVGMLLLFRKARSPRVLGAALSGAALLSTAWMIFLYEHGAGLDRLYYGTDTRVAELLTGALLGVVVWHRGLDFSERTRWVLASVGLAAFAATVWCWVNVPLADGPIWRGGYLLFSLASSAVILGVLAERGPLAAFMKLPPFPAIGRITYGLYLYHWPIFLWLTEQRTGLSVWPLFALRCFVTFTAAIISYHFIERPILRGATLGLRGRARFALAPLVAVAIVLAATVMVNRAAYDPLAALRVAAGSQAVPPVIDDGPFSLLVIPGRANDPVVSQLRTLAAADHSITLTVAPPFECTGGLVETKTGRTCANWATSWPQLIQRVNPDSVLLYVDDWGGESLTKLSGLPAQQLPAFATKVLSPALDLLSARGAPVVWASSSTSFAEALVRSNLPFVQAMARLKAARSNLYSVIGTELPDPTAVSPQQYASQSAAVLLSDASLYRRAKDSTLPRVMIVGDSQALTLGYGLDQWAQRNKRALVWNHGIEGCGLATEGDVTSFGSTGSGADQCREAVASWPSQIKAFKPKVVVALSSLADLEDRKLPGSSKVSSIGDPDLDAFLVKEYDHVVDVLSAGGAHVVWMTPPCLDLKSAAVQIPALQSVYSHANIDPLATKILPQVARDRPGQVSLFDLAGVMCPGGKPLTSLPGVGAMRPDGVHFSVNGSLWFANTYGDKLLEQAGIR